MAPTQKPSTRSAHSNKEGKKSKKSSKSNRSKRSAEKSKTQKTQLAPPDSDKFEEFKKEAIKIRNSQVAKPVEAKVSLYIYKTQLTVTF